MIEFSGTISRDLLVKAQRLQMARLVPIAVMIALAATYGLLSAKLSDPGSWGIPLFFLLLALFVIVSPYLSARTQQKTDAALRSPISGSADENHFVFISEIARVDMPWEKMHRATVRNDFALLYPSAGAAFIIAREFFDSDDSWAAFRTLVAAKVHQPRAGRPVLRTFVLWLAIIIAIFLLWSLAAPPG